ncbi:MAG: cation transporter, partial [Oscillospiraceae bacterium]|nr:cation transporter [Oscillospiraceae bacterium]
MEMVLYLKNLACPHCAEKIRAAAEKIPFVKTAEMNFMAKKLSLTVAAESDEAVFKEVSKIVADMEPDVEVQLLKNAVSEVHDDGEDSGGLKLELIKIIVAAAIFAAGFFFKDTRYGLWIFLVAYMISGLEVLITAAKNIAKFRPFDECFLMTIATLGAFCIGEYPEGAAVMILYQVGELFQSYAVRRSRKSISELMDIRPDIANVKRGGTVEEVPPETVEK